MRTKTALQMLERLEREHARERASLHDERERLLDRIMLLADKPLVAPWPPTPPSGLPAEPGPIDLDEAFYAEEG